MRVQLAVAAIVPNSVYINVHANLAAGARRINMCILITNLNPYPAELKYLTSLRPDFSWLNGIGWGFTGRNY